MPASMMIAETGEAENVDGSSSAMAAAGPSPGSTPTRVPMKTPAKQDSTLTGWSATWKPCRTPWTISTSEPEGTARQLGLEPHLEQRVAGAGAGQRRQPAHRPALPHEA